MTISVAAIDDGSLAMHGAIEVLRNNSSFSFVGLYASVHELDSLDRDQTVVLLVDPFPDLDPKTVDIPTLNIPKVSKPYAILAMSAVVQPAAVREALQLGARGYISKSAAVATLLDAIRAVGVGGIYVGDLLDDLFVKQTQHRSGTPQAVLNTLTPRERDVLGMVAQGLTHRQIGSKLNLSKATVDTYVHRVRQKVGSVNKAGLTRIAMSLGLLDGDT